MKPSNELFDLIQSLTKSEKRFFKLHSALQSGEKNYLRIFDAVDKQKAYDEEAIKKQFAKETFIRHFPSEKNHLYKLVLKALRAYHAESSVTGVLKQHINNIEILFQRPCMMRPRRSCTVRRRWRPTMSGSIIGSSC